jgi:ferritin-like protein
MSDGAAYRQNSYRGYDFWSDSYRRGKKTENLEVVRRCLKALPKVTTTYYYYDNTSYYQQKKKFLDGEEKRLVREIAQASQRGKENAEKLKNMYAKRKTELANRSIRLARKVKEGATLSPKEIRDELYFWE